VPQPRIDAEAIVAAAAARRASWGPSGVDGRPAALGAARDVGAALRRVQPLAAAARDAEARRWGAAIVAAAASTGATTCAALLAKVTAAIEVADVVAELTQVA
jgi:hypothetical protein